MKRPTFNETVDVLVKAYLNDELQHDDCTKCVIGNLCNGRDDWQYLFMTDPRKKEQTTRHLTPIRVMMLGKPPAQILVEAIQLCESTGYTVNELKRIEFAFETAPGSEKVIKVDEEDDEGPDEESSELLQARDEWMFNGLMAVVDVLAEIHNIDLSAKESAKLQFVRS
jgi:hypothetical protein